MAIENETVQEILSGDDVTMTFSFPFKIYADTDITAYLEVKTTKARTLQVLGVDYSVTINPIAEGGTITFLIAAPATTDWVDMLSNIAYTQPEVIPTDGNLREKSLEDGLDRSVRQIQQVNARFDGVVTLPAGVTGVVLPEGSAGAYIGWNSTGDNLTNLGAGVTGPTGPVGPSGGSAGATGATGATGAAGLGSYTTVQVVLSNSSDAIATGVWGDVIVPFDGTITNVTLLADQAATMVIDIWKDAYANFPPTVADTITAAAKPTLTAADKSDDATLTGWDTGVLNGDVFRFNVDSNDVAERVTLSLEITRST